MRLPVCVHAFIQKGRRCRNENLPSLLFLSFFFCFAMNRQRSVQSPRLRKLTMQQKEEDYYREKMICTCT